MLAIYGPRFSGTNEVSKRNWRTARIRRLRGRPLPVTWRETRREGISQSLPPETVVGEEVGDRLRRHPRSHTVGKPMQQVGRLCASQASGSAAEVPSASRQPVATVGASVFPFAMRIARYALMAAPPSPPIWSPRLERAFGPASQSLYPVPAYPMCLGGTPVPGHRPLPATRTG
jgi:hypothetical protein